MQGSCLIPGFEQVTHLQGAVWGEAWPLGFPPMAQDPPALQRRLPARRQLLNPEAEAQTCGIGGWTKSILRPKRIVALPHFLSS